MKRYEDNSDDWGGEEVCYYQSEWLRDEAYYSRLIVKIDPAWVSDEDQTIMVSIYNMYKQPHQSQLGTIFLTEGEIDKFIETLQEAKRRMLVYQENGGQKLPEEELKHPFSD